MKSSSALHDRKSADMPASVARDSLAMRWMAAHRKHTRACLGCAVQHQSDYLAQAGALLGPMEIWENVIRFLRPPEGGKVESYDWGLSRAYGCPHGGLRDVKGIGRLSFLWLSPWEESFNGLPWHRWLIDHSEVPIFAIAGFLLLVFALPVLLANRRALNIRWLVAAWNAGLSAFSAVGAMRLVPYLVQKIMEEGFRFTVCEDPRAWFAHGPVGAWQMLFIYSKMPELLDTLWLILRKRKIIFLHWFHHSSVLLYCWHSYLNIIGPGLWFSAMNYTVHAVMYMYYCLATFPSLKPFTRHLALPVTLLQIAQMVVGVVVTSASAFWFAREGKQGCHVEPSNLKLGIAMYVSYLSLFTYLFLERYLSGPRRAAPKAPRAATEDDLCGEDAAGLFHTCQTPTKALSVELEPEHLFRAPAGPGVEAGAGRGSGTGAESGTSSGALSLATPTLSEEPVTGAGLGRAGSEPSEGGGAGAARLVARGKRGAGKAQ